MGGMRPQSLGPPVDLGTEASWNQWETKFCKTSKTEVLQNFKTRNWLTKGSGSHKRLDIRTKTTNKYPQVDTKGQAKTKKWGLGRKALTQGLDKTHPRTE